MSLLLPFRNITVTESCWARVAQIVDAGHRMLVTVKCHPLGPRLRDRRGSPVNKRRATHSRQTAGAFADRRIIENTSRVHCGPNPPITSACSRRPGPVRSPIGYLSQPAFGAPASVSDAVQGALRQLAQYYEERPHTRTKRALCPIGTGGRADLRHRDDGAAVDRAILGDDERNQAPASHRRLRALYLGDLCRPFRQLFRAEAAGDR